MLYARLMTDISKRRVLLLYPLMSTGTTVVKAVEILLQHGVKEDNLFLVSIFATPLSIQLIRSQFAKVTVSYCLLSVSRGDESPVIPGGRQRNMHGRARLLRN